MSINQVTDIEFCDLLHDAYDVAIFASGYEERCIYVPKKCEDIDVKTVLVVGFESLADEKPRKIHDKYFIDQWKVNPYIASSENDFAIQELLNNVVSDGRQVKRILVDYSSMSRLWYSGILNWARFGNIGEETIIDFVYAFGHYEEKNSPMIIENMFSIPGCEGSAMQAPHSVAVFGLGFNGWASLSVLERLEADEVFAFIASPGSSPDYVERVQTLNKDFLEEPRVKEHVIKLPISSVENSYRFLLELVAPHRLTDIVSLVPMGPKPHILASILVSMRFPEVSCMRVSARRETPEKIKSNGNVVVVRVVVNKETTNL